MPKVRVQDIAAISHYSVSTVSRALNNSPLIGTDTKEEVQKIAYEMGYYANRRLPQSKSNAQKQIIGVCVNDISNPMCPAILGGIQAELESKNTNLLVMDARHTLQCEMENLDYFRSIPVDGIILLPTDMSERALNHITSISIPTVTICNTYTPGVVSFVGMDYADASYKAAEYLINLGHRRIAYIGSALRFASRESGMRRACDAYGVPIFEDDFYAGDPNYETGFYIMESILRSGKDYTSIVAANDYLAMGAINCIDRYGLRIPDDFSIVGFDNVEFSGHAAISLTTINQPAADIGAKAVELLKKQMDHPTLDPPYHLFESSLIIRNSCRSIVPR